MRRAYERGTKARLSFSGGLHAPVNMADSMEEVNVGRKDTGNGTFSVLYSAIFRTPSFRKSLSNYQHSPYYPACGPPEKLSLALAPRSIVVRMVVELAYIEGFSTAQIKFLKMWSVNPLLAALRARLYFWPILGPSEVVE